MSFDLPALLADWSYALLDSFRDPNAVNYGEVQSNELINYIKM